jgi:hypothetical protein
LAEYQAHHNTARPHQGIAQHIPNGELDGGLLTVADLDRERIHRKPVLGGSDQRVLTRRLTPEAPQVTTRIIFSSGSGCSTVPPRRLVASMAADVSAVVAWEG